MSKSKPNGCQDIEYKIRSYLFYAKRRKCNLNFALAP